MSAGVSRVDFIKKNDRKKTFFSLSNCGNLSTVGFELNQGYYVSVLQSSASVNVKKCDVFSVCKIAISSQKKHFFFCFPRWRRNVWQGSRRENYLQTSRTKQATSNCNTKKTANCFSFLFVSRKKIKYILINSWDSTWLLPWKIFYICTYRGARLLRTQHLMGTSPVELSVSQSVHISFWP